MRAAARLQIIVMSRLKRWSRLHSGPIWILCVERKTRWRSGRHFRPHAVDRRWDRPDLTHIWCRTVARLVTRRSRPRPA